MRSREIAAAVAAVATTMILAAGCGSAARTTALVLPAGRRALASTTQTSVTTPRPPSVATPVTSDPTVPPTSTHLPISVESDSQMVAEGNEGPTSSILLPGSCQLTGTMVTAEGGYTNGGFVPYVYDRYGDVIVLYVFGAPSPGYPRGAQLGVSGISDSPAVGTPDWQVSETIPPYLGSPARCVVAAQPTHDEQLAP